MTVQELIEKLETLPRELPVVAFCPMDAEGPETWENPSLEIVEGQVRIGPDNLDLS